MGSRDYLPWIPQWLPPYAERTSAIIVSPDYPKLPNSNGAAILSVILAFHTWLHMTLPSVFSARHRPGVLINASKTLLVGPSAGGYLSVQHAISRPDEVRAIFIQYPQLDVDAHHEAAEAGTLDTSPFVPRPSREQFGAVNQRALSQGPVVTERFEEWTPFANAMLAYGQTRVALGGTSEEVNPIDRAAKVGQMSRRVWLVHGEDDHIVDVEGSRRFVDVLETEVKETEVRAQYFEGADHGFDWEVPLDEKWLKDGLAWLEGVWLA